MFYIHSCQTGDEYKHVHGGVDQHHRPLLVQHHLCHLEPRRRELLRGRRAAGGRDGPELKGADEQGAAVVRPGEEAGGGGGGEGVDLADEELAAFRHDDVADVAGHGHLGGHGGHHVLREEGGEALLEEVAPGPHLWVVGALVLRDAGEGVVGDEAAELKAGLNDHPGADHNTSAEIGNNRRR